MCNYHAINAMPCPMVANNFDERTFLGWVDDVSAPGSLDVPCWKIHRVVIHMKEMEGCKCIVWGGGWRRWREKRTDSRMSDGL
jgi:hypothetical protein